MMLRRSLFLALSLFSLGASTAFAGTGSLVSVRVVDRDGGGPLPEAYSSEDARPYVVGVPGHRYSVRLTNRSDARVLVVLSVDGVNAITGETAGVGQNGYVLAPHQQFDVSGWRKSDSDVAEFLFTTVPDSYAARTGRAQQVGVIGVAAFREYVRPAPIAPPMMAEDKAQRARAAADAAESGAAGNAFAKSAAAAPSAAPSLGTGHGERVWSPVSHTEFERASSTPNETLTVGYDSRARLVARGILQPERPRVPNAFPADPGAGYVPDPR